MFLPENYEAPKQSNDTYMKLEDGENKIRILSQPIMGWEDWTAENKPVRFAYNLKPERPITEAKPIRHFWSLIVWNYHVQKIQILHLTQASIRGKLEDLYRDKEWGQPYYYDIKIFKSGKKLNTKYEMNPSPHRPVEEYIKDAFHAKPIYLEAILTNEDPFAPHWKNYTQGIFDKNDMKDEVKKEAIISNAQARELNDILEKCDMAYQDTVWNTLRKAPLNCKTLADLPLSSYERLRNAALKKREENAARIEPELPF